MPNSSPCLVWDFCGPFIGSGHYNGHIMPLWVGQNTCQEWSRLIMVPVEVGGPLVTQCTSFPSYHVLEEKAFKGASSAVHTSFPASNLLFPSSCNCVLRIVVLWIWCVCGHICVCMSECLCIASTPPQSWMALAAMSHTVGSIRHEMGSLSGVCVCVCDVCVCVCLRRLECRFHILQIMRLKTCHQREEFQQSYFQTSTAPTRRAGALYGLSDVPQLSSSFLGNNWYVRVFLWKVQERNLLSKLFFEEKRQSW